VIGLLDRFSGDIGLIQPADMLPIRTLILSLSLLTPSSAQAQQPFVTDDANVTPKGHFHFEFSNEFDLLQRSSYPSLRQNTADFELDYGPGGGVKIRNFRLDKGQLQGLIGGNYAVKKNLTFDFGVIAGKFAASPRVGAQLGISVDW
jgi:hypothetical protein